MDDARPRQCDCRQDVFLTDEFRVRAFDPRKSKTELPNPRTVLARYRREGIMAELSTDERNALADRVFGLPQKRTYPMPDESHARNAKARAGEEFKKGNLSSAEKAQIDRRANEILGEA
jgi:hypothetical protein